MLILTNINVLGMLLDLMHAEFFRYLMVTGLVKNVIIFGAIMS